MAKADRLERLDAQRAALEEEYAATLIAALQRTAGGAWGLFGHKNDRTATARYAEVVAELTETGEAIDAMRAQLGIEPFALHHAFLASRGPVASSKMGEPRQARAWLEELGIPVTGNAG
ncbi:hypothetical protein QH494_22870 [Sphingomonas sp. AR_OL41]|jgi:hypothetical protein|uniref:hypothetical protein n=1 Tax=Sphingomonas sp. AR_OL41 TaxID=3042729 RepID=UPI0024804B03|nr:hypothetical protein [Sphingomonas sp. AR_OL41]MDH7975036.1 hypothetical protein [Sphingomonas sp. AR_OL41]